MSPTTRARSRAADDGLGVMDHLGHRDADGRLVAQDHLAERIADEQERDARPRRAAARSGSRRRSASRSACHRRTAWRCRRRSGRGGVGRCAHAGSRLGSVRPPVWVAASRSSSATATRSRSRSATSRLVNSGRSSREPSAARIATRLVSVPKPEPPRRRRCRRAGRRPCGASFSGGPIERTGLGGEPDETGAAEAVHASAFRQCRARGRSARSRPGGRASARARGSDVLPRSSLRSAGSTGRKSATAAAMTRASKPAAVGRVAARSERGRRSAVDSTRTTVAPPGSGTSTFAGDERHPRAAVERGLGDGDAHPARWSGCR